ncbi:hypothetical protein [Nocardioides xinjiangensis]|uniref:hypothetical protein n=1 Tax=Nocardioides xinjiangensis TaxID=2817376 RepID=UPI001B3126E0|nr:hypothetical protein [Nocardioides sp. SYSU D00778]
MTVVRAWVLAAACCLALAGCADGPAQPPEKETPVDEPSSAPSTASPPPSAVQQSVADLAASLGLPADEVEVVSVEEVTWRNGSRGCARAGMAYTQALVDGSRIVLRAGGRTYEYHAGGRRPPERCDEPTE